MGFFLGLYWVPGLVGFEPLDQMLLSSALKYILYFNLLKIFMFRATKNLSDHLVTFSRPRERVGNLPQVTQQVYEW